MVERILFCPRCNSSNIHPFIGGMTGSYQCPDCGYIGSLVIQKDFVKSMETGHKKPVAKRLQSTSDTAKTGLQKKRKQGFISKN